MIDYQNAIIEKISIHFVGNQNLGEQLRFSSEPVDVSDDILKEILIKYFLSSFNGTEYFSFSSPDEDLSINPMYKYSNEVFTKKEDFHQTSKKIATHLYESSEHPYIKSGDLFVVYFSEICVVDEIVEAIGVFKSETKQSFLRLDESDNKYKINHLTGIDINKLDKGCIIFNTFQDTGYKVCIVDKSGKSKEAHYWKDDFLNIHPCDDEYHRTKGFLEMTKESVTNQMAKDYGLPRTDQIDYLNKSMDYFKNHEDFDRGEFEKEIFANPDIIDSFRDFDTAYTAPNPANSYENFNISPHAVKKSSAIYKSVLKLDKNFHVYIHGNRNWIERGTERDGRKYYKLYYENEM